MMEYLQNILLPFGVTFVITWLIGFERQNIGKSAGISSHVLISMATCAVALLQQELFLSEVAQGVVANQQRVIAQVVTGVGFLGAGVILKSNRKVQGLTTATTIWACAIVGLVLGMGYWKIGLTLGGFIVIFMYLRDIVRGCNPFVPHREPEEGFRENDH